MPHDIKGVCCHEAHVSAACSISLLTPVFRSTMVDGGGWVEEEVGGACPGFVQASMSIIQGLFKVF